MLSERRTSAVALLLTLLGTLVVHPTDLSADPPPDAQSAGTQPAAESADESSQRASSEGKGQEPQKPFVPSESISADSAVAFPVDI